MSRRARSRAALRATWLATILMGRISGALSLPFVRTLWFTPWRVPVGARERQRRAGWIDGSTAFRVGAGGTEIAGFYRGEGPTVLLVHGWGEEGASLGAFVGPLAAAGFRAAVIDLPGHGASGDGPTNLYTLGTAIREAAEQLDARAVIAHSMGSASTLLAVRDGLQLDAAAFIAPPSRLDGALDEFARLFRIPRRAIVALIGGIEREFGPSVWEDTSADLVAPSLALPALLVHDRDDRQVPFEGTEHLAALWPTARLLPTNGLGHTKVMRDGRVVEEVISFLRAILRPSAVAPPQRTSA